MIGRSGAVFPFLQMKAREQGEGGTDEKLARKSTKLAEKLIIGDQ
jgi:hypothetical protein